MTGLMLLATLLLGTVAVREDFSVADPRGGSYAIDIERHSTLTHCHGWIKNGEYLIPVEGNRHFVAAPPVSDFELETDYSIDLFRLNFTLGYKIFFRWDREADRGDLLEIFWDKTRMLRFVLNGRTVFVRQDADPLPLERQHLKLSVDGAKGVVETLGAHVEFGLTDAARKGSVGVDLTTNESEKLRLHDLSLTSPENPATSRVGTWKFVLAKTQGFVENAVYDVTIDRYAESREALVTCALSGTLPDRKPRQASGGREWSRMSQRWDSPYLRLTAADGTERKLYLWNGVRAISDPFAANRSKKKSAPLVWPCMKTFVIRDLPDDFSLAAGYEHALTHPNRFAANGPYEQIRQKDGTLVYEGDAVRKGFVAFAAKSPETKRIVAELPADLPEREKALKHAREQHYFRMSEPVEFVLSAVWRSADYEPGEIVIRPRLESVFGRSVGVAVGTLSSGDEPLAAGLVRRIVRCRLVANPGIGVWHLETELNAGAGPMRTERTIFEVLPEQDGGPCPPLVSGLPTFVSMPNEIRDLEESAFDPWSDLGGISHYYAIDQRYPKVGMRLKVWEADHFYSRKWFTTALERNTDDLDPESPANQEMFRHVDYLGFYPPGKPREGRFDLTLAHFYIKEQFAILKDYLMDRKWPLKLITPERLAICEKEQKGITTEELEELFTAAWEDFRAYAKTRIDAYTQQHVDRLLSANPKLARASYGPMPIYTATYRTAYDLEKNAHPIECDPRIAANGSFFLLEDYHYSCDYPLCRPAYFLAGYRMLYPQARRIFPEIYYKGWGRCEDGAVYQAHPDGYCDLAATHQRRIAYQYVYGTCWFADGRPSYWTDYGFHARTPQKHEMDQFVYAWGRAMENKPVRPLKSPYVMVDPEAFRRHGDTFSSNGSYALEGPGFHDVRPDIFNTAEEDVSWAYEECVARGYVNPVVTRMSELDLIDADRAEFVILPPIVKGTPQGVLDAVRRAHRRGVNLLGFESVAGLEDLFGLDSRSGEFVTNRTEWGRTAFVNCQPTLIGRSDFLTRYQRGRATLSKRMEDGLAAAFAFLAPSPSVKTERGDILAAESGSGDIVVVLSDSSPLYGDTDEYPATFRFTVSSPDIGNCRIEADAPYSVVSRSADRIELRTRTGKDTALFFVFRR